MLNLQANFWKHTKDRVHYNWNYGILTQGFQKQSIEDFLQNRCFKNFANFTGQHVCWSLFLLFKKAAGLKSKQEFSCEICLFKNTFFLQNTSVGCFWDSKLNLRILTTGAQQFFLEHIFMATFEIVRKSF